MFLWKLIRIVKAAVCHYPEMNMEAEQKQMEQRAVNIAAIVTKMVPLQCPKSLQMK
jgi:hypothetical protein